MKVFALLSLATVLLSAGCSRYGYIRLNYPTPPEAYLPEDVNSMAAVNRSLTKDEDADERQLEAIVTSEVAGSDLLASDNCVKGVHDGILALPDALPESAY